MKRFYLLIVVILNCTAVLIAQNSWELLTTQGEVSVIDANAFGYVYFTDENNGWACGKV